jgi:hypothetical protein
MGSTRERRWSNCTVNVLGPWRWLAADAAAGPPGETQPDTTRDAGRRLVPSDAVRYPGPFQQFFSDEGARERPLVRVVAAGASMSPDRPARFVGVRWLGDKRTMVVHDLDAAVPACGVDEVARSLRAASFGPDSAVEARNRGYRPCRHCRAV